MLGEQRKIWLGLREPLILGQVDDPPGDPGRAMDELHTRAKRCGQFILDQREMGAGQHHGVDLRAARLIAQAGGGAGVDCRIDRFTAQLCFRRSNQFTGRKTQEPLVGSVFGGVVGAVLLLVCEEVFVEITPHWQIGLGMLLLAVVLWAPLGIAGLFGWGRNRE